MSTNWEEVPLGELVERVTTKNTRGNTNVLTISAKDGLVSQRDYFKKQVASENLAHYFFMEHGEFAYNKSYSDGYPVGAIKRLDRYPAGVVSPLYICFRVTKTELLSSDFLVQYVEAGLLEPGLRAIAKEGARNHGLLNVKPFEFLSLPIRLPPLPEQRTIASVLSAMDDRIKASRAVTNQLAVLKAATMTELLTQGVRRRHPTPLRTSNEVDEAPEHWTRATVGDLATFRGGNGFRPPDWSTSGLPIIRIQNLNGSPEFNHYAGPIEESWLVEPGELLFAWAGSRGASFGPCLWPGPRGVLNQHIHRIIPHSIVRKPFLFYVLRLLTSAVEKKAHGFKDSLVHLRKGELTGWLVAVPPLAEQDEIIAVLGALQERIDAEERELSAITLAKQTLATAMLCGEVRVQPDGVVA